MGVCGGSMGVCGGSMGVCGGSMVVHQTVKPAVPGSNPASLQPAGTCHSLLGSQQRVGIITAGWPLRGGRGTKNFKNTKKIIRKKSIINLNEQLYVTFLLDM